MATRQPSDDAAIYYWRSNTDCDAICNTNHHLPRTICFTIDKRQPLLTACGQACESKDWWNQIRWDVRSKGEKNECWPEEWQSNPWRPP